MALLGVDRLLADLKAAHQAVEGPFESGKLRWLIVPAYVIPAGRYAGKVVKVAIAVPDDYPQTTPGGLYVSPRIVADGEMGGLNIHNRNETDQLAGQWQYWSRPIKERWSENGGARQLVKHWNSVMAHVN